MKYVSLLKYSVAAGALLGVAVSATTADAGSASGTASASIEKALAVSEQTALNFGRVEAPASGNGTVVISASGTVTDTSVTRLTGATAAAASFQLTGTSGAAYTVSAIPTLTLNHASTSATLDVTSFTNNATGTLTGGTETFGIGGTLTIPSSADAGTYSGSYNVVVNYN